jgi:acetyl esterase
MSSVDLHPQVQALLEQMKVAGLPPLSSMPPAQCREVMAAMSVGASVPDIGSTQDVVCGGIACRVYRPFGSEASETLGAIVWYHGGGWVIGSVDGSDRTCRSLANASGCAVVSVEYRLAPEDPFPAATDDSLAALQGIVASAAELGIDPARVAVGGDSAGGNLAAVTALRARDEGGPALAFQVLIYPVTDGSMASVSYTENATGFFLEKADMEWFYDLYAGPRDHWQVSPLMASSLAGLPPAIVITASHDPLRDEGEAYARALSNAGVRATLTRYPGMIHGFFSMTDPLDHARDALAEVGRALRTHIGG